MFQTMHGLRIGLVGHSHMVALLDALGEWRSHLGAKNNDAEPGFAPEFRGYHSSEPSVVRLLNQRFERNVFELVVVLPGSGRAKLRYPFFKKDKIGTPQDFTDIVAQLRDCSVIVSVLFGSENSALKYVGRLPRYYITGFGNAPVEGAQPVDRKHAKSAIEGVSTMVEPTLCALKAQFPNTRIFHAAPPAPVEDPESVMYQEGMNDLWKKRGALDSQTRKIWAQLELETLQNLVKKDACERVFAPPPESLTANGFMRPELCAGLTHGNAEYGRLVWRQVFHTLQERSA